MQILLEHDMAPGTVYENRLILGECCAVLNEMDLNEAAGSNGTVKFKGKFQEAEAVNKNKRICENCQNSIKVVPESL